jgi:tetratricopeptide (TPR) repeat protein
MKEAKLRFASLFAATLLLFVLDPTAKATDRKQLDVGMQLLDQNKYEAAAAVFHKLVADEPKNGLAWEMYGSALDNENESKNAIAAYTQAISLGNTRWQVYHGKGLAYAHLGDFDESITELRRALRAGVPNPNIRACIYADLADAELSAKHFSAAAEDYSKFLTVLPRHDRARLTHRARAYAGCGKLQEAINDMSTYLQIGTLRTTQRTGGYLYRAELYSKSKDYNKAIADLSAALALDHDRTNILRERAKLYDLAGKKSLADQDRAKSKQLDAKLYGDF